MRKKIIITGGHLTPALAVANLLDRKVWDPVFMGRKYALEGESTLSVEYKTTRRLGLPFIALTAGRIQRSLTPYTFFSLLKIPLGFFQSLYWLIKLKPTLILSFGGYLALPVALGGWILGVPVVTHEQSAALGLANKIIAVFAKKVIVSWPQTLEKIHNKKFILTGNPIRKEILNNAKVKRQNAKIQFKIQNYDEKLPLLYITGGSLGSHAINETVKEILPKLLEKYDLIHQCGDSKQYKDFENLELKTRNLEQKLKSRYFLTKYINSEDIGWVLNNADLVIGRSGANTVTELAALGKPAILIPLPWAGQNEQMENAKILKNVGIAEILEQKNLTSETLCQCVKTMIQNLDKYRKNGGKARELVDLKAAEKLAEVINKLK